MAAPSPDLLAAARRHLLAITAADFATSIFHGNASIETIEITITRDGAFDGNSSIDVQHQSKQGFPLEGYSL